MSDPLFEAGERVRREVLGDEHVDRAQAATTAFTAPFQEYITRAAWGSVWARDGLDRRTRSCITLAVLTALGREHEIAMHVRAALRHGLTPAEIGEVLLQTGVYAGVPTANRAFAIAQKVLDAADAAAADGDADAADAAADVDADADAAADADQPSPDGAPPADGPSGGAAPRTPGPADG